MKLSECIYDGARRGFSRRDFGLCCAAAVGAIVASRADRSAAETSAKRFPAGNYFDIHTHLGQTWNTTKELDADTLLRWMDANNVAQAAVLPLVSPESSSYPLTTDFVLAQTKPHRDRLIPFCSVDPRTSFHGGQQGLVDMLKRYIDLGARGFGEHKPGLSIDDPRNMAIYRACAEAKLPVLFHLDQQRNMDQPGLPGLERALNEHPHCTFIGHGPGWWASISGDAKQSDLADLPKGPVNAGGAIDTLMDKHPNLYGDLSAASGAGAIERDLKFGREFLLRRAERLMFGTDFLSPGQGVPQFILFRLLDLPAEAQAKIFRDNARRVLGLS